MPFLNPLMCVNTRLYHFSLLITSAANSCLSVALRIQSERYWPELSEIQRVCCLAV
ncbi:hypothetical protein BX661DRAFT_180761 [Kickxella alabastrina]|uniref:uncharacterized protein n=1 Tax=Kickxella alabastrina TaxID=61397 RepID=UPI00221EFDB5|nr:uncharacterized protein BX661DRAFT_180761 [Kickxella alabastrina]KAI7829935.1 hypothetical protein BX661DRAFT_180761 [Kickxella alabastrina]